MAFVDEDDRVVLRPVQNDIRAAFGLVSPRRSASLERMRAAVRKRELVTFDRRLRRTAGVSPV